MLVRPGLRLCDEVLLQMERKIGPPVKKKGSGERPGHHEENAILLLSRLLPLTVRSLSFLGTKTNPHPASLAGLMTVTAFPSSS